jgi:hypothetical protein
MPRVNTLGKTACRGLPAAVQLGWLGDAGPEDRDPRGAARSGCDVALEARGIWVGEMESVYLETTVVSYLAARPSRDLLVAAHQQATHDWWRTRRQTLECYVSQVVLDEVGGGDPTAAPDRMALIADVPVLAATEAAERLTEAIVASGAMPAQAVRDAAHWRLRPSTRLTTC